MYWYFEVLKKYAVFSGRARRKEYWMFVLYYTMTLFAIAFIGIAIGGDSGLAFASNIGRIYELALLIPHIAVGIRIMHDIGRSGWWILLPIVNIVFFCLDSQPGHNEYGKNPKNS